MSCQVQCVGIDCPVNYELWSQASSWPWILHDYLPCSRTCAKELIEEA